LHAFFPRIGLAALLQTQCGLGFARPQDYGIADCKERALACIPIGIVFGDDILGMMVAPCPEGMK